MENGFKRFLSLALAIVMVLSNVPVQAFATDGGNLCEGEHTIVNFVTEAKCTEEGSKVVQCMNCSYVESTEVLPAKGHSFENGVCTAENCGAEDPDYVAPAAEEHEHDWGETVEVTPASCEAAGVATQTCSAEGCGVTQDVTIDALGHDYVEGICSRCQAEKPQAEVQPESSKGPLMTSTGPKTEETETPDQGEDTQDPDAGIEEIAEEPDGLIDTVEDLADAIAAAQDGATIVLGNHLTIEGETFTIAEGKSITLDMNGKKLTVTDNKDNKTCYELFYIYGELTVIGEGTIELISTSNDTDWLKSSTIFHNRGGKLTIENGTFNHTGGTAMAFVVDNNANSYGDATTNIKGGTLTSTYVAIRNRMDTYGANGTPGNGIPMLIIEGGELSGKRAVWGQVSSAGAKGQIYISGGKLTADVGEDAVRMGTDSNPIEGGIVTEITGGTFSSDVSAYVPAGYEQNEAGEVVVKTTTEEPDVKEPEIEIEKPETVTKEQVQQVVTEIQEKIDVNTATNVPADMSLVIELAKAAVDANVVPTKLVYNVAPMRGDEKQTNAGQEIIFRLPIPESWAKTHAKVTHDNVEMGIFAIQTENGDRYVSVTSQYFSEFAVEPADAPAEAVAKIGDQGFDTLADALAAAKTMTGDVVVEINDKVTLAESLSGSYDSIKFVGKKAGAEIYLDVQGYITATGKKVAFEGLTLSKSEGGFISNAGFMNVAFGIYDVAEVTYTDCTFANGACASFGKVTFTRCTFYKSHDKYGLWAYGNVDVTVDDCTFANYRGIKMYAENKTKTVDLTVKDTDFSAVTDKPAIVLTYGESVVLKGNTYSNTGVFELDLDGAPNGTAVNSDVAPTCVNDKGACGVLVDGKIYTTVAQAAEVATSGSTVTLLHDSAETVELAEGVTLNKNGFAANGVTEYVKPVAKVGNTEYGTIDEAIAAWTKGTTLTLLADVTLSDVIKINTADNRTLNLSTYTMTAASGKNAIEIVAIGTGDSEQTTITINADENNPGGINAGSKCIVYYKYADAGITKNDRPIIKINGGVFTGPTNSIGPAGIYTIGTEARKCATVHITGGTFNCTINGSGKSKLIISGGTFNYAVGSQGDSTALRLISGGTFKTFGFMTADSKNTKFWFGTEMAKSDVGVHVNDDGYIVVGGPVITEAGGAFEASSTNYSGANSLLQYSSAKNNGLYYTEVEEAFADNNTTSGKVTVYVDELDMSGINFKGTIVVPDDSTLTITNAPAKLTVKDETGNVLKPDASGTYVTPKGDNFNGYTGADGFWGEVRGNARESFVIKVLDANGIVMGTTTLNNIGGIIDGDVSVTWNLKLDAAANTDEYWTMNWTTAPSVDNMPAKVELWVDGVKVSGGNVVLNGPDDLNKIYAAVADANGKIVSYHTSTLDAISAAANGGYAEVRLLRDCDEQMPTDVEVLLKSDLKITAAKAVEAKFHNKGTSYDFVIDNAEGVQNATLTIGENVTFNLNDRTIWMGYYGRGVKVVVNGTLRGGYQIWSGADVTVNSTGKLISAGEAMVLRRGKTLTVDGGNIDVNYINILSGHIVAKNSAKITTGPVWIANAANYQGESAGSSIKLDNSTLTSSGNLKLDSASVALLELTNGSEMTVATHDGIASNITANGKIVVAGSELTMQKTTFNGDLELGQDATVAVDSITGAGTIIVDITGMAANTEIKVSNDLSGFTGEVAVTGNADVKAEIVDGKIVLKEKIYVAQIGDAKFESLSEALTAAQKDETITLLWAEGNAPIAMNGSVFGKSVTITGTATVDWSKGFLFVGRGGEGNGTVIFDNANLTSASDNATYGIHVSGREKNTTDKYDGTLVIKDSTIELDYLINRNNVTVENSKLIVKNGFDIHGRPAAETESSVNAIATFTATNSDITVVNENGMGLGREGNGKLDITGGSFTVNSVFNVRQAADVVNFTNTKVSVPKGIANAGTITVTDSTITGTKITGAGSTNFSGEVNFYGTNEVLSGVNGSDFDLIVNKGATLLISRFVLGYNRNITVYGEIADAHAFDPTGKTPSLKFNSTSGVSVGGTGTGNLTVENAYVELGNSSWKNAYGSYTWNFKNSYVSATSFTNSTAGSSESAVWNVTFDDSVLVAKNYIKNGVGATYNFTNGSEGTTGSLRIDGVLNIDETSSVATTSQQNNVVGAVDEHGGINGTVNVAGKLTIGSNAKTQLEVLGGELNVTGGTLDLGNHTLTLDAESEMTSSGNISGTIAAAEGAEVAISGGTYTMDVQSWCVDGFSCEAKADGTYGVRQMKHLVINVGSAVSIMALDETIINVPTMDEAVDAAKASGADYVTYKISGAVTLTTGGSHGILDLGNNVTIEGTTPDAKLTIVGGGVPDIKGVTFKNIILADEGTYLPTANEFMYQNYIDCSFENVTFVDGIRLSGKSTLTDCTVDVNTTNEYAIWLDEGEFAMTGTTVTGGKDAYGLIKSDEVDKITISGNTFQYLGEANKEALNVKGATIVASNNTFIDCTKGILPTDKTNFAADGTTVLTEDAIKAQNEVHIYVAQIGNDKYDSLADAIAAVSAGEVAIELLKDATLNYNARDAYGTAETTKLTIDGNGHKLTLNQTNSDWASIGLKNADGKLTLKNMTINKSGKGTSSTDAWNTHAIIFSTPVEMTDVTVNHAIAVGDDATLTNVTINEANGFYGLWIEANGQTVTVDGGSITATNGGRGIKIADQYVDAPASVTLSVTGTVFNTAKKAAVLVSSTAGAEITATNADISGVAEDTVNFAWVDEDWAADYSEVTVNGAPAAQEGIENFAAAIVGEKGAVIGYYADITAAVNDCTEAGNYTIKMLADYAEDVTILQKEGVNITIDGDNKTFSGTMNIHGGSNYGSDTLTIQNVQFETDEKDHDFIWSDSQEAPARYAHNVTVKDCDFTATGAGKNTAVGLRFRQAKNIDVINCSASGMHSLMQVNGGSEYVVDNVSIVNCKNGVSFTQADDVTVKNSYIKTNGATGYGIRGTGYTGHTLNVESCDVNAYIPVLVRKTTGEDFTLNVTGDNSMKATNKFIEGGAWAVISANDASDADPVAPSVDFNLNVKDKGLDILDVYPGFVASIGTEMYRALAEAVTEAEAGDTITLLTDITLAAPITVTKSLTIDGGAHTLTYTGTDRAIDVPNTANGANVTVKNLNVNAEKANRGINYNTTGKFTVENVTVIIGADVDGYAINLPGSATGAEVTIKNSNLTSRIPLNLWSKNAVINVEDTEITSVDNSATYFYSAIQLNNDGSNAAEGTVVNVTGGKITALDEKGELSFAVTNWTETGIVNISETTVVTGNINNIVAWIGGAGFTSLQSALNSEYTGEIKILRDFAVSEAINVPAGKKVTIDLNGKTITGTDNATASFGLINIQPGAELTINDTVGTAKITLTATNDRDFNAYSSVISNQRGKLTVNGGTIEHLGGTDMAYGIDNLTNGKGTSAETVINGGTVKSTYRAIRQFLNGVEAQNILTVNGGTIEGANKSIWMQDPSANANTGSLTVGEKAALKGDVYLTVTAGSTSWPVEVSINTNALKDNAKVLTNNVPAGYGLKETNGVIGVVTGMVAKVGENYYETLDDAFKAAKEGDEIEIVAPGTYALNTSGKDITITGAVDGVVFDNIGAYNMGGASVTFNNVTFTYADDSTYKGLQHAGNLVYNNCTFNGQVFLYGESETFNKCTFNQTSNNYNVWTYGAKEVAFNDCTFNSAGKSVLIYAESASVTNNVTVTGSTFVASTAVEGKAAIEMDSSLTGGISLTVTNSTATGFGTGNVSGNSLWNNKKGNATDANNDITVVVNGTEVLAPKTLVAEINGVKYISFQDAIDAAKAGDNTITLLAASDEDVTIKQVEGVNIVIDGGNNVYSGTITIHGNARYEGEETLTIQNFQFVTEKASHYFIDSNSTASAERYAHNVTVKNSSFTATGAAVDSAAAMRIRQGFDIAINDVTATGMHSLFQGYGVAGLSINGVKASDMKNGISAGTSTNVSIKNVEIEASGYGIRADGSVEATLAVENANITAKQPIIVRKNTNADYSVVLNGNELSGGEYDVIFTTGSDDEALKAPTHAANVTGAEELDVFPVHVASANGKFYDTLKAAIDAAVAGDNTITLLADSAEDVTVKQVEGVNITIDGNGKTYSGTITIHGNARYEGEETLTIQNFKFVTDEAGHYFIDSNSTASAERYAHNVTVKDSSFTAVESSAAVDSAAAMRIRQGFDISIENVTATDMHSLLQAYGNDGITIIGVTVNGKNGIAVGTSKNVVITNADITATGYGIRADGEGAYDMTVKASNITAEQPIVVRKNTAAGYQLALENNTLNPTNKDGYHVVFTKGDDDEALVAPDVKPVVTGAEGLNVFPVGVAKIGNTYYATLQAAIEACQKGDNTIELLADTAEDVTIKQTAGVNIVIDGGNNVYSGTITIHGAARHDGAETLVIQNFKFVTDEAGHYFIDSNSTASAERYAHNVTVTGSSFTATGAAVDSAAAMRIRQGFDISIENVTATDMHSLLQAYGNDGITITGVTVDGKNGISVGTSKNVVITNATITADAYGIRADGDGARKLVVNSSSITAEKPIVVRKNTAAGYEVVVENNNLTGNNAEKYQVIFTANDDDEDLKAPAHEILVTGNDNLNVFPVHTAKIGNAYYETLQEAIGAAQTGDNTITLLADSAEDVTVKQTEGVNIVIDGGNHVYSGTITIHGAARYEGKETLTIQNFQFVTEKAGHYFIDSNSTVSAERYAHNVTVKDSSFAATGAAVDSAAAMRIRQGFNIAVEDVETKNLHSLLQAYGNNGITINDVIVNGKNGISVGTSTGVVITKADITATGYGIRADGTAASDMTVKNANINAEMPIVVRKNTAEGYKLTLEGTNNLTGTNDNGYQVIFTKGDDGEYETPEFGFELTGAEGLKVFPMTLTAADIKLDGVLTYNGTEQTQKFVASNGATFTVTGNTGKDAGTYTATITGTGNYIGSVDVAWTIAKKAATITAKDMTIVAGNDIPAIEVVQDGVVTGESLAFKLESVENANQTPGTYEIKVIVDPAENSNYEVTPVNGKLTVQNAVAKVGTTNYATLKDAIAGAKAGDTITFLADIEENVTVNKNLTIDGAKFKYTGKMGVNNDLNVTVQNINFVAGYVYEASGSKGYLTVKNCDFDGVDNTIYYAVTMSGGNSVTIEDCTAKHYIYGLLYVPKSVTNVTVKDSQISECALAINITHGSKVTLDNVKSSAVEYSIQTHNYGAKTITIRNCDLEGKHSVFFWEREDSTNEVPDTFIFEGTNLVENLEVKDCTLILNPVKDGKVDDAKLITPEVEGLNIKTNYAGYKVVYDTAAYKLVEKDYVAQIGENGKKFETLAEAVAAAQNGETVKVIADHQLDVTKLTEVITPKNTYYALIYAATDITIDLNGKTVSALVPETVNFVFYGAEDADVTIIDSSKDMSGQVSANGKNLYYMFNNSGTMDIMSGNYTFVGLNGGAMFYADNSGMNVYGGKFTQVTEGWMFNTAGNGAGNIITVHGGLFNRYFIGGASSKENPYGEVVLAEGKALVKADVEGYWTIEEAVAKRVDAEGKNVLTYNNLVDAVKDFQAGETIVMLKDTDENLTIDGNVTIDVNGKNITGAITLAKAEATLTVSAEQDAATNVPALNVITNVPEHTVVYVEAAGMYKVAPYVAQVGEEKFATLNDAIAAANNGDTVKVIADHQLDENDAINVNEKSEALVYINKSITIDLNGYNLTAEVPDPVMFVFYGAKGTTVEITGAGSVNSSGKGLYYMFNNDGKMTISDGDYTFNGINGGAMFFSENSNMTVTGGKFTQNSTGWMFNTRGNGEGVQITVSGGLFNRNFMGGKAAGENDDNEVVLAEGKQLVESELKGYWTLVNVAVAQNINTGVTYDDVQVALDEAASDDTVQLLTDVEAGSLMVTKGITLDLNGNSLTATYLAAFNSNHVVDNSTDKTGKLIIDQNKVVLASDNSQMPVWIDNHYRFATMNMKQIKDENLTEDMIMFGFRPSFGKQFHDFFADGMDDNGLKVVVRLSWMDDNGRSRIQEFVYTEEHVKKVYEIGYTRAFTFLATGLSGYKDMKANFVIVSDLKVEAVSKDFCLK